MPQVASLLDTSVPRVRRAMGRLGLEPSAGRRGRLLNQGQVEVLRRHLGHVLPVSGLSRESVLVLAALNRRPLGVRSARAIARSAGTSATVAARAIKVLTGRGLVERAERVLAEGAATKATVYSLNRRSPEWPGIAAAVRRTELPAGKTASGREAKRVPSRLRHHFWNATPETLRLPENADFVAARLLRTNDPEALSWACAHLPSTSIEKVASLRGLSKRDRGWLRQVAAR